MRVAYAHDFSIRLDKLVELSLDLISHRFPYTQESSVHIPLARTVFVCLLREVEVAHPIAPRVRPLKENIDDIALNLDSIVTIFSRMTVIRIQATDKMLMQNDVVSSVSFKYRMNFYYEDDMINCQR